MTLIKSPTNPIELNEIIGYLTGIVSESKMVYVRKAQNVVVRSRQSIAWTLDGEFGGNHWNVEIKNQHRKVNILVKDEI